MEKMKTSKSVFYLTAGYLWLAILWIFYRLWGQSLLYGALPELPAALAEGGIKLLIYGLPVLLLFLGLGFGSLLGLREIWQAACAFAGLAVGLGIIKLLDPKLRKMRPVSRPCNSEKFTR